ncbi:hypothetical protein ABIB00_001262 [Bradyrhizobium sp. LB14.3]|uniref:hypothetical protein n=1 Tax=Bradyrhizobium sp. LB14.3 TaxID=3156328 RepID=UPI0033935C43
MSTLTGRSRPKVPRPMSEQFDYSTCDQDRAQNIDDREEKRTALPTEWEAALADLDDEPAPASTEPEVEEQLDVEPARVKPNYRAMFDAAEAKKKLAKGRNRQQRHRARPRETSIAKLASSLRKAIAKSRGNKQLEQLGERVAELAGFRFLSRIIIAQHGPMSDAALARHLDHGDGFTRKKVWQLRQIVADLEANGGPWHDI